MTTHKHDRCQDFSVLLKNKWLQGIPKFLHCHLSQHTHNKSTMHNYMGSQKTTRGFLEILRGHWELFHQVLECKRLWVLETGEAAWEPSRSSKFVVYRHVIWRMVSFQLPPPWRMVGCFSWGTEGCDVIQCHLPKSYILKYHNYKFEQRTSTNFMYIKVIKFPKVLNYQDRKYQVTLEVFTWVTLIYWINDISGSQKWLQDFLGTGKFQIPGHTHPIKTPL